MQKSLQPFDSKKINGNAQSSDWGCLGIPPQGTKSVAVIPLIPHCLARGNRSLRTKDQFDARKRRVSSSSQWYAPLFDPVSRMPPTRHPSESVMSSALRVVRSKKLIGNLLLSGEFILHTWFPLRVWRSDPSPHPYLVSVLRVVDTQNEETNNTPQTSLTSCSNAESQ